MGKLQHRMRMEMELRNFSPKTIKAYLWNMKAYTRHFMKSPDEMGEKEIKQYLHYLKVEKKVSYSNINIAYSALRFFYVDMLHREWHVEKIPRPKVGRKLPVVLSREALQKLFAVTANLKHRLILLTTYSAGLRVSEVAQLKITDIDSQRMQIRVKQGKGQKNRYTLLSKELLCTCQHEEPDYFECESWQDLFLALTGVDLRTCPSCGQGRMVFLETIYPEIKPPP